MITFQEFQYNCNLILERYYAPDEKLPSGKTPVEKAKNKLKSIPNTPQTSFKTQSRRIELKRKIDRKVSHGADNPDINIHSDSGVMVHQSKDKKTTQIDHPKSGIYYEIFRKNDIKGKPHHEIDWNLSRRASPEEHRKLAHTTKQIYDRHVQHRLPHGSIVSNTPATSTHEKIYRRYGFGDTGEGYRQYAKVGREPSPKQKAKGKRTRLKPVNPEDL